MKKLLQLDSKSANAEIFLQDQLPYFFVRWTLNFSYMIQNISICLNHNHTDNIIVDQLTINCSYQQQPQQEMIILDRVAEQTTVTNPLVFQKIVLEKVVYLFNTIDIKLRMVDEDVIQKIESEGIKILGFEGLEIDGFNIDVYQSMEQKGALFNLYSKLLSNKLLKQADIIFYHLAQISKNSSRLQEAQEMFLKLFRNDQSRSQIGSVMLLVNLIDCCSKQESKMVYLRLLCNQQSQASQRKNLFKQCETLIPHLIHHFQGDNCILSTTILNILSYFISRVGCSAANCFESILECVLSVFEYKSYLKNLKRESFPNYEVILNSIEQILEGIRQYAGYLVKERISKLCKFILPDITRSCMEPIHQVLVKLAHSFVKECQGDVEVTYEDWFRLLYLMEGEDLFRGVQIKHDMYYNKELKLVESLYEDYKKNILMCLSPRARTDYLNNLNKHFVELVYSSNNLNIILITHFVEILDSFCLLASEHTIYDHSDHLLQFFNPFKALISRLVESCIQSDNPFKNFWNSFLMLYNMVQSQINDSLNDIIVTCLNRFTKDGINSKQVVHIYLMVSSFSPDGKYPEFWERFSKFTASIIPNSLHVQKVYLLLLKTFQIMPSLLESDALITIVKSMLDPYSEYREQWISIVIIIRGYIIGKQQLLLNVLRVLVEHTQIQKKLKSGASAIQKKYQVELQSKKVYFLQKLLSVQIQSKEVLYYLLNNCDKISSQLLNCSEESKYVLYYKFFVIRKILSFHQVPFSLQNLEILQLQDPPITFSLLICLASARKTTSQSDLLPFFKRLVKLKDCPWKNIQHLALQILVFFSRALILQGVKLADQFLDQKQNYKILIGLTILHQLTLLEIESEHLELIVQELKSFVPKLQQPHYSKQIEALARYVLCKLNNKFKLGFEIFQMQIEEQQQKEILLTFDYEHRIDNILKKELQKPIENILKLDAVFAIPRKNYRQQDIGFDEGEIIQKITTKDAKLQNSPQNKGKQQQIKSNHQNIQKIQKQKDNLRLLEKQLERHIQASEQKIQELKESQLNSKKDSPIVLDHPRKTSNTIKSETPKVKITEYDSIPSSSAKVSKPLKTEPKKQKHQESPIIQIQSKSSKFKINLGQLNQTWRENLQSISKKPKDPKHRKSQKNIKL